MIDGLFEFVVSALAALAAIPLGFFFPCSPCCGGGCGVADGKPRTDPANEGTWVPSGTWRGVGGVTWTFTANPGDDSGETWFFYGSASTSKVGGGATLAEQRDWGNLCNWYSNKTTSPSTTTGLPAAFDKRATRMPPVDAVVHIYTFVSTGTAGPQTAKYAYFWGIGYFLTDSSITLTAAAHDSAGGAVFNNSSFNLGTVNGGAVFNDTSDNFGGTVNGGAVFNDTSDNNSGTVNGGAVFNDDSDNFGSIVNGGAVFNDTSDNLGGTVNGGAVFNDTSRNGFGVTVNGGAVFNDAACSEWDIGYPDAPCTRKFVAHPTDLPTCNGTAPDGCATPFASCGCG